MGGLGFDYRVGQIEHSVATLRCSFGVAEIGAKPLRLARH